MIGALLAVITGLAPGIRLADSAPAALVSMTIS